VLTNAQASAASPSAEGMPEPAGSRPLFEGRWVRVDEEDWPGVGAWEVVRTPDAAGVLPITPEGEALLVRQFRPPVRHVVTEIPAGLLDVEGEDAQACAARELYEETGFRHASLEFLAGFHPSAGHSAEFVHLFLAQTLPEPEGEPEDGIELTRVPFSELVAEALAGRLEDVKTALAVLLADARMTRG
jgi:8-oxo-dGTP pyrophosphatase MutT (NUDIX family)